MRLACLLLPSERRKYSARTAGQRSGLARTGDAGFSFVEIVVAMGIFALVATFMAQTLGSGLRGVLLAKRREVATQLANQRMEEARSLSYNAIGLIEETFGADPDGEPGLDLDNGLYEERNIVWVKDKIAGHPFANRLEEITQGSTSLKRYTYVTWESTDLKRIEVRVTWDDSGTQGPLNEVRVETLVNESGLIPTGRAGKPLTGRAFASGGYLNLQSNLLGLPIEGLNVTLPTTTGSSSFRAVQTAACTTRSASIQALGLVDLPGYSVAATADDDPRTAVPSQSSAQHPGVLTLPPGPVTNLIGPAVNSPVACEAHAEGLASEQGSGAAVSILNANHTLGLNLNLAGIGIVNWLLTLATLQTLPVEQEISNEQTGASRELRASSSTGFESIRLLDLPILDHGVVRVDAINAAASVTATDAPGGGGASVDSPAFMLRILDATNSQGPACGALVVPGVTASRSGSYCVVTIDPGAAGFPGLTPPPITGNLQHHFRGVCLPLLGCDLGGLLDPILRTVDLGYSINVSVLPPASSPVDGEIGPNGERRWIAQHSPISVSAALTATLLGTQIINAAVDLDLGTVRAEACSGATCS